MHFFDLFTIFCVFGVVRSGRLNVPVLLLPYNADEPTTYRLEISGGYYKWSSSNPDIVAVISNSDSSTDAIISAISTVRQRQFATISAENITTGETLRCDVILDILHSISIEVATTELTVEGLPSVFKIKGKTSNGETFSSLSGIKFEWKENTKSGNVLKLVNFDDSLYKTDASVLHWERKNLHGYEVLVEGIGVGIGKLRVQPINLTKSDIQNIKFKEIEVLVKSNIKFKQQVLYLIPLMKFPLSVQIFTKGKADDITELPDDYAIKVKKLNIATVTEHFEVIANQLGQTNVRIYRKGLKQDKKFYSSVQINVVEPSYITLNVLPENKWAFQELHVYIVTVKVFDVYHHQIDITENLQVKVRFPSKHFRINYSSLNGTYHILQATVVGSGDIAADLIGITDSNGKVSKQKTPIKALQHFVVYQSLQIYPPVVLLPWDDSSKTNHTISFKVTGGTGVYKWSSSNSVITNVQYSPGAKSNVATVAAHGFGDVTVDVNDANYDFLTVSANVSLQSVADLDIMPTIVETQPGNDVILPVSIYGYEDEGKTKLKMFDDCSKIPLSVNVVDPARFTYVEETEYIPMGKGCQSLQFTCKLPGHSRIYIKYKLNNEIGTTAIIGCNKPLKPVQPERLSVIALGSSLEVAFEGGPRAWPMYSKGHYDELTSQKADLVTVQPLKDQYRYNKDLHVYFVTCASIDQSILEIKVGNVPSATLSNPAKDSSSVKLVCALPSTLHLRVHKTFQKRLTADTLPSSTVTTKQGKDIEIDLWVKDNIGRKFANISSFDIIWELSDYTLAKLKEHKGIISDVNGANGYRKLSRNYQILYLTGKHGTLKITARIKNYQNRVLKSHGITKEVNFLPVNEAIEVKLVSHKESTNEDGSCTKDGCPNA